MKNLFLRVVADGPDGAYPYTLAMKSLVAGDVETFITFLQKYMRHTPSYFDTSGNSKEQFYHGLLLGMGTCLLHSHEVKSNKESGDGRYDIALFPREKKGKGVILELKVTKADENLEEMAQQALSQIQKKGYRDDMESGGIKDVLYVGIAFRKKEVAVVYQI